MVDRAKTFWRPTALFLLGSLGTSTGSATLTGFGWLPSSDPHNQESRIAAISSDGKAAVGYSGSPESPAIRIPVVKYVGSAVQAIGPAGSMLGISGVSANGEVIVGTRSGNEFYKWTKIGGGAVRTIAGLKQGGSLIVMGLSSNGVMMTGGYLDTANALRYFHWNERVGVIPLSPQSLESVHVSEDGSTFFGHVKAAEPLGYTAGYWREGGVVVTLPPNVVNVYPHSSVAYASTDGKTLLCRYITKKVDPATPNQWEEFEKFMVWHTETNQFDTFTFTNGWARALSGDGKLIYGQTGPTWEEMKGTFVDLSSPAAAAKGPQPAKQFLIENGYVTAAEAAAWQLSQIVAISADRKVIVGNGGDPQGHGEGWIATKP